MLFPSGEDRKLGGRGRLENLLSAELQPYSDTQEMGALICGLESLTPCDFQ